MRLLPLLFSLVACCSSTLVMAGTRPLLDIVDIQGVRDNQLVGYGLVVGLPGPATKRRSSLPPSR